MGSLQTALIFLISTLFDLYLFVLIIRLVLAWVRSHYYDPLTQFVVKLTQFLVNPLRRIIPNIGRLETACLVIIIAFVMIKFFIISMLSFGTVNPLGLFIMTAADTLRLLIQTFFYAILFQCILSFVQPQSPINYTLQQFTAPIMRPIRRWIPLIAGIDISPIPAIIGLQLLLMLIVQPLMMWGAGVSLG